MEQQYINGFNSGYILARHEPQLLNQVAKNLHPLNDYLDGLLSGREEFEMEKSRSQLDELQKLREQSKDRNIDLEREA